MATFTITSINDSAGDTSIGTLDRRGNGSGTLRQAINFANRNVANPTVVTVIRVAAGVTGTIFLVGNLPPVATSITLDGGGLALDGSFRLRGFFVSGIDADGIKAAKTTVGISNLTIQHVVAQGGAGADGGGGGLGAGGAVFVGEAANVTLTNVNIETAKAVGGAGAGVTNNGRGGGGGLGGAGGTDYGSGNGGGGGGLFFGGGASVVRAGDTYGPGGGGGGGISAPGADGLSGRPFDYSGGGGSGGGGLGGLGGGGGGGGGQGRYSNDRPGMAGGYGAQSGIYGAGGFEPGGDGGFGGFGGGGGGGGYENGFGGFGGFGGGGGGSGGEIYAGGNGGFGGGGGAFTGSRNTDGSKEGGFGGFGAGNGAGSANAYGGFGGGISSVLGGGGGGAMGGAIFVTAGGTLTIAGTFSESGGVVTAGAAGGIAAHAGSAYAAGIFYEGGSDGTPATLSFGAGDQTIADVISDLDGAAGNSSTHNGLFSGGGFAIGGLTAIAKTGSGTLKLVAGNSYTGGTRLTGGTVELGTLGSAGFGAVKFDNGVQTLQLDVAGTLTNTLTGFGVGDIVDLRTINSAGVTFTLSGQMLTVTEAASNGSDSNTLSFGQLPSGYGFALASDGAGGTRVILAQTNHAPATVSDVGYISRGTVSLDASLLLANDSDSDGDSLSIQSVGNPTNGTVSLSGQTVTFTGTTTTSVTSAGFDYTATDGSASSTAHVTVGLITTSDQNNNITMATTAGQFSYIDAKGGNDSVKGGAGNDTFIGGAGNDRLDGGAGIDTMIGGSGDDTYYVDNSNDIVREFTTPGVDDGGLDTVRASASFTLGAFIENLVLSGTAAIDGTGNDLDNKITGNSGANHLIGGGGADTLTGGGGADILEGGEGGDTYNADSADTITDTGTTGTDTVITNGGSIFLTTGDGIENLALSATGTTNANLTGNEEANRITGNAGNNYLKGMDGNDVLSGGIGDDRLEGGAGKDTLTGGAGIDTFIFKGNDSPATVSPIVYDSITDFVGGTDRIDLDVVGQAGLTAAQFSATTISTNSYSAAFSAAQAQFADALHKAVFVAGTTDGWLFWNNDSNATTADAAVRLAGANTLGAVQRTDIV